MARSDWGIGLVGLGGISRHHLEGYAIQGLKVVGGADISLERVKSAQEQFKFPFATDDFRELIDHPEVRIVDIIVPHDKLERRLPIVEYAASKGKAIFIQKPMMPYLDWAKKIVEVVDEYGVPMMVNQNSIFAPGMLMAEYYMRDYSIMGRIYYCQIENRAWVNPDQNAWVAKDERWVQSDMAVHHFALVRHWFGDVKSVYAILARDKSQEFVKGDTVGVVNLVFKNGIRAVIINNWSYRGNRYRPHAIEEIVVQGDKGVITFDSEHIHVKCADGREMTPEVRGKWFPEAFGNSMAHFVDSLDNRKPFYCSAHDNLKTVAIIEATYISAKENKVVIPDELLL